MTANILDVEYLTRIASLENQRAALMLYDFKTAFSSVNHKFMWAVLLRIGPPPGILESFPVPLQAPCPTSALARFPLQDFCDYMSHLAGCLLSPLLCADVIDVFLRRLHHKYLSVTRRAFADDIGVIVQHVANLMVIHAEVLTFATISGLALNLPKTILVPSWHSLVASVARLFHDEYPGLAGMTVSYSANCLGVWMGPEGQTLALVEALDKFRKAVPR
jgi:hypothetical protein